MHGRNILTARSYDQLLGATRETHISLVIDVAQVAGMQPTVIVQRLFGLLLIVYVAHEYMTSTYAQFTMSILILIDDLRFAAGQRFANGIQVYRVGQTQCMTAGRLGHAEGIQYFHIQTEEIFLCLRRHGRRGAHQTDHTIKAQSSLHLGQNEGFGNLVAKTSVALAAKSLREREKRKFFNWNS